MNKITPLPPFSPTCCGVLPQVYGDGLSYYEELCKLQSKINEIVKYSNNELTEQLKNYIDMRFNSIMLEAIYDEVTETITLKLKEDTE